MLKINAMQKKKQIKTLQQAFNQVMTTGGFPSNLKNADVTPIFEKNNPLSKEN